MYWDEVNEEAQKLGCVEIARRAADTVAYRFAHGSERIDFVHWLDQNVDCAFTVTNHYSVTVFF